MKLRLEIDKTVATVKKIHRRHTAGGMKPLLIFATGEMLADIEERFDTQGHGRWTALSPITKTLRAAKGYWPGKKLTMRGDLAKSIQGSQTPRQAIASTNKEYAPLQHYGGQRKISPAFRSLLHAKGFHPRKTTTHMDIPARPFMLLSVLAIKRIEDKAADFMLGK